MSERGRPHVVAVLVYERMSLFETGIVTEVFGVEWGAVPGSGYQLELCAENPAATTTVGGGVLRTAHGLEAMQRADTVIVPSVADIESPPSPRLVAALRAAHRRGARIASICSGAFALAEAGLLDGRRATTHWMYARRLAERYPKVDVDPKPLFIDTGAVLTSAGSAAGLDLSLHLVRRDHGGAVAGALARRLIAPPHRDGGQAQYIESPVHAHPEGDDVAQSMAWALENLDQPLTVMDMARSVSMAPRTYLRRFTSATATSPIRWLNTQRVEASLDLLETSNLSVEEVSAAVGFQTAVTFRYHFGKQLGTSPSAYRRSFRGERSLFASA